MSAEEIKNINEFDDFMNDLEESIEEASTPRGVAVAKVVVEFGYPIFVSGLTAKERIFKAPPGKKNKEAQAAAKELALAKAKELAPDQKNNPRFSLSVRFLTEGAKKILDGEMVEAGWKDDLVESAALWTMGGTDRITGEPVPGALQDYHIPALKNFGLMHEDEVWCLIGITPDPYKMSLGEEGKTDEYEGEARYPMIRYISKVFGSQEEAYADLVGNTTSAGDFPAEYGTKQAWLKVAAMITKELDGGATVEETAVKYEVDVKFVQPLFVP